MSFEYAATKFSTARRCLMLPFPEGIAQSIAHAFHECELGLRDIHPEHLDENSSRWVKRLRELMNTDGLSDPNKRGLWAVKAESLSEDQQLDLAEVVDELQYWFKAHGE